MTSYNGITSILQYFLYGKWILNFNYLPQKDMFLADQKVVKLLTDAVVIMFSFRLLFAYQS